MEDLLKVPTSAMRAPVAAPARDHDCCLWWCRRVAAEATFSAPEAEASGAEADDDAACAVAVGAMRPPPLAATMRATSVSASCCSESNTVVEAMAPCVRGVSATERPLSSATSTVTFIDRPTRNGFLATSAGSSAMRTGTRCTTLIQLPVAFWAGSSENAAPVPAPRPSTLPWKTTCLP